MNLSKISILKHFLRLRYSRWFSADKVSRRRKKRWKKNLTHSQYYNELLLNDQTMPIMNKALFMQNFDAINTVGIKKEEAYQIALASEKSRDFTTSSLKEISIGLSSGTSGNRGIFLTSKAEKEIWVAAVLDRVLGFSFRKRKIAFFLRANNDLYGAVQSRLLSFNFFDIQIPIPQHMDALQALQVDILVAQPSILMAIANEYKGKGIAPTFKKVIAVAEVLEEDQKMYLSSIFRVGIDQVYQCTEGFLAYTCKHGQLHLNEDWLKIEKKYLDEEQNRFHPIITDYLRTSQPIIRYELNDILHEAKDYQCPCGTKSTVITKIEGRSDDVFRFLKDGQDILIYPDFIRRAVITASAKIINYKVTLVKEDTVNLYLEVDTEVEKSQVFQRVSEQLVQTFLSFGIPNIQVVEANIDHDPLHKFTRVKNEYSKTI